MSNKKRLAAIALSACMVSGLVAAAACSDNKTSDNDKVTYRSYTVVMPSNWNELTYEDNNDLQILQYISGSFFEYDYQFNGGKFKEDGTLNVEGLDAGAFSVQYSAATKLEDVTADVDAKWGYTAEQKADGGYAWKITLRNDIKWDDGTPIDAYDFVYSMKQQLDPLFKNMRASTYYNNITIKNARDYVFSGDKEIYVNVDTKYDSIAAAKADGETVYLDMWGFFGLEGALKVESYDAETDEFVLDEDTECPQYVSIDDTVLWLDPVYYTELDDYNSAIEANPDAEIEKPVAGDYIQSAKDIFDAYAPDLEVGGGSASYIYFLDANDNYGMSFDEVGIYAPSQYEIVLCLDNPIQCLKEDGSFSYEAAYSLASLPLVKEDLYESCKKQPQTGSTLWTTNYNSSVETSASWGPYKLTAFQSGKSYVLERNENWYGYNMDQYNDQYLVDSITCEQLADTNTQWMSFLSGTIDNVAVDLTHREDYGNSKYVVYTPGTGTFGLNLLSDANMLKGTGHNSGILAITDFRKAISLSINRDDYNAATTAAHQTCYGLLGPSYYYDIENASTLDDGGVYRNTRYAKEALLRVYGFTENADGTWTDSAGNKYDDYDKAYEVMNGYNPEYAKELVESAYQELTSNAEEYGYDANKKITFVYGTAMDNANTRRDYEYIKNVIETLISGTPLEGKIEVTFNASYGSGWASQFQAGAYEIASGVGYSGGPFDPAGFLQCYLDPEAGLMFTTWWDTSEEELTYTMPVVEDGTYADAGKTFTMSLYNWYCCLNGIANSRGQEYTNNWGTGAIPEDARLQLTAKLEEIVLEKYYSIMTTSQYSASLMSAKFSYVTTEYNPMLDFGGLRYVRVNYNDAEWSSYIKTTNLEQEYKKTN